jgi:competence protein ComEC
LYLAVTFLCLYFSSLLVQTSVNQPSVAVLAAKDFKQLSINFCLQNPSGKGWAIKVQGGQLPSGAIGWLSQPQAKYLIGDCLIGRLQLSHNEGFSRFAFQARLKEIERPVRHSSNLAIINAMRNFAASFRGDSENLVAGLSTGIDSGLSEGFLKSMKATGLTHLTAVSGANCAIVLGAFWLLLRAFRVGKGLRFAVSLVALAAYLELVGPQPSVLRAAFMMSVVLLALEFGRRVWIPAALIIASGILLVIDPWLVIDYGFWLSVLATFGLVILTPALVSKFEGFMPKFLAIGLAATLAAQIWCLPLLLQLQGGFTTYSVLANLLVEPMVPAVTLLGLLGTISGPVFAPLGVFLFQIASIASSWIVWVANSLAQAPESQLPLGSGPISIIISILFVIAISFALLKRSFWAIALVTVLLIVFVSSSVVSATKPWPIKDWQIVGCDVGQGDSLVIRSQGQIAVIDVGKDPELIDHCLDRLAISKVDLLVLTHFDFDHVGGLSGLERGRLIKVALLSPFPDSRPEAKFLKGNLDSTAEKVIEPSVGFDGQLGDFHWMVFSSLKEEAKTANQGSLGIRFEDPDLVIYTLADLDDVAQCRALGFATSSSKTTIVKVSHHGSADQCPDFYRRIQPEVALISVGKGNPYGHPTKKALDILDSLGATTFRTDTQGAVSLRIEGREIEALVAGAR